MNYIKEHESTEEIHYTKDKILRRQKFKLLFLV